MNTPSLQAPLQSSYSSSTSSSSSPLYMASPNSAGDKHKRIIEKLIGDLEDLCRRMTDPQLLQDNSPLRDDCYELQKFCAKFEYLLQYKLKEKRSSLLSTASSVGVVSASGDEYSSREYWSFLLDALKGSRGFQDALKFAKSLTDVKTPLGRGRAFIRFCLQYHRLADAVQQLTMEEKIVRYDNCNFFF
jgi:FYVE and coiled-coil domain-containing protein 1